MKNNKAVIITVATLVALLLLANSAHAIVEGEYNPNIPGQKHPRHPRKYFGALISEEQRTKILKMNDVKEIQKQIDKLEKRNEEITAKLKKNVSTKYMDKLEKEFKTNSALIRLYRWRLRQLRPVTTGLGIATRPTSGGMATRPTSGGMATRPSDKQ